MANYKNREHSGRANSAFSPRSITAIVLCSFVCLLLAGCVGGGEAADAPAPSILEGKLYSGHWNSDYANRTGYIAVVKFSTDGVVELVHVINAAGVMGGYKSDKYYGTYELEGRKLEVVLSLSSDVALSCVVHDEGESITIAGETFKKTAPENLSEETVSQFDD